MKTNASVCTLCLLLCVAGSYAQTISRGQPGSSSTVNNVATNNAAYNKTVSHLTESLDITFESIIKGHSRLRIVGDLTFDIRDAFALFIDETLKAGHGLAPPEGCTKTQIDVDSVSKQFSQTVGQAFDAYEDNYVQTSSDCLSKAVFDISFDLLPMVNERRCTEEHLSNFNHLGYYEFEYYLLDTVDKLYLGLLKKDESKARNCYDLDKLFS